MTAERFFGGVDDRLGYLSSTLEYVSRHEPTKEQLVRWITEHTPAESVSTVRRNVSFLVAIDLLDESDAGYDTTNKGEVFWSQAEPLVMYEGLETEVDGFRTIARSIPQGYRTVEEIQRRLREEFPNYDLPEGVVTKHLDWLVSLDLVEVEDSTYSIPIEGGNFEDGKLYSRWFLHDVLKGERYKGISTPGDHPLIFIFTGDSGEDYGYEDEFKEDGTFWYTGEGTTGDMSMDKGNKAIRDHRKNGKSIHLFEDTDMPWIVQYVGELSYFEYEEKQMDDENGDSRTGFRFHLRPIDDSNLTLTDDLSNSLSDEAVFERAKKKSSSGPIEPKQQTSAGYRYPGSEEVRRYAVRIADGVCQGCRDDAPFTDKSGEPYLEVHHIEPRSSGGADAPHNVIAICANCHRRVHSGQDGSQFNEQLKRRAEQHYERFDLDK